MQLKLKLQFKIHSDAPSIHFQQISNQQFYVHRVLLTIQYIDMISKSTLNMLFVVHHFEFQLFLIFVSVFLV